VVCYRRMEPTLSSLSGRNVLLGVTGSVAAIKAPALVRQWQADGAHVQVLLTQGGRHFWDRAAAYENGNNCQEDSCGLPGWLPPDVQIHGEYKTCLETRHTE
jgi:Flavoprotein